MSLQEHRKNEEIISSKVRFIDHDGEMIGIINTSEALMRAYENDLDLIEIQPNQDPPVCKAMDFGKFRYEQQKKSSLVKKHQKKVEVKEIQFKTQIGDHDYQNKLGQIKSFLDDGNKVRVSLKLKGWDMAHPELVDRLVNRIVDDLKEDYLVDDKVSRSAKTAIFSVSPAPKTPNNSPKSTSVKSPKI